uniref:Keratin 32 n=1 Tax=Balaenoptera musculus TaxID=9771 RepID=A0A8C0DQQ6_BALMU
LSLGSQSEPPPLQTVRAEPFPACSTNNNRTLSSSCQPSSCRPTSRISSSMGSYSPYFEGSFNGNEKETMQFLSNHLASYLERVQRLERDNAQLETPALGLLVLLTWVLFPSSCPGPTPSVCCGPQVLYTKAENARMIVNVDNAKLAADDFRTKYEMELATRQLVEADASSLRRVLDELTLCKADLEMQNHEEVRPELGDRLNVEVDAATPVDLNRVLEEMWCQYGALVENNRRDAEGWFTRTEELNQQGATSSERLQSYQSDISDLRRTVNTLEIELQAQHSLRDSLENTLAETEAHYSSQLAQMQCLITSLEVQLADIHCDLQRQNQEYKVLLDVRAWLEFEINAYRGLLENDDCNWAPFSGEPQRPCCGGRPLFYRQLGGLNFFCGGNDRICLTA